jgi:hypothetical protein
MKAEPKLPSLSKEEHYVCILVHVVLYIAQIKCNIENVMGLKI